MRLFTRCFSNLPEPKQFPESLNAARPAEAGLVVQQNAEELLLRSVGSRSSSVGSRSSSVGSRSGSGVSRSSGRGSSVGSRSSGSVSSRSSGSVSSRGSSGVSSRGSSSGVSRGSSSVSSRGGVSGRSSFFLLASRQGQDASGEQHEKLLVHLNLQKG
jgi:hypothetical protein